MNDCVEILMATFNGAAYLRAQIDSILRQTDDRWHLTISDDGSTDDTPAIIDDYVQRYPAKMTRHVSGKRFGNARDHFFHLMSQCHASYVFFCDQDDAWYPEKVRKTMTAMLEAEKQHGQETPLLVFSDQTPTDTALNPLAPSLMRYQNQYFARFDYRSILMQNVVTGGAMAANRALMALAGGGETDVIMHDWWMAAVAAKFGRIVYIDEPLGVYRQHDTNSVGAKNVSSSGYVGRKLTQLGKVRVSILKKKAQARAFAKAYALQDAFFTGFCKSHSGIWFYLKHRDLIHGLFRLTGLMILG